MVPILFRALTGVDDFWVYAILLALILLWWFLLRGVAALLRLRQRRPVRVVILTHWALFLVGGIFLFNLMLVPVVLVAFHGVAMICLLTCAFVAVVYLTQVDDRERPESIGGSISPSRPFETPATSRAKGHDPFS